MYSLNNIFNFLSASIPTYKQHTTTTVINISNANIAQIIIPNIILLILYTLPLFRFIITNQFLITAIRNDLFVFVA